MGRGQIDLRMRADQSQVGATLGYEHRVTSGLSVLGESWVRHPWGRGVEWGVMGALRWRF